ncbi:MAG: YraN family protein [Acidimicrobiales bacterium]
MPSDRQLAGARGESLALEWYTRRGYRLVARDWRCRQGELDLVVSIGTVLVVCEVKARSSDRFGTPVEAVTLRQQRRVRAATAVFLRELAARPPAIPGRELAGRSQVGHPKVVRFDVASVRGTDVEILEAAF